MGTIDWQGKGNIIVSDKAKIVVGGGFTGGTFTISTDAAIQQQAPKDNTTPAIYLLPKGLIDDNAQNNTKATIGIPINMLGGELRFMGQKVELPLGVQDQGAFVSLDQTTLSVPDNKEVTLNGSSTLTGTGTINPLLLLNQGVINPGGASGFGTISVIGSYSQAPPGNASGTLDIALDNPSSSNTSALLAVQGGPATLGGTLNLDLPNGFTPSTSALTYTILTDPDGVLGTFATVNVIDPSGDYASSSYALSVCYTSTAVYVVVVSKESSPTITSLSTTSSSTDGGQAVTITGTNLDSVQSVLFGDTPATSYTVVSSTEINAVAPANPTSASGLTVVTASGSASTSFSYTATTDPVVYSLGESSGYLDGGEAITINGSGFTGATSVAFGSEAALAFSVVSDTQIVAYDPSATTTGPVDVTVTDYNGTSATSSADQFTYEDQPAPTVFSLNVSSGSASGGTSVTITGTNFANVDDVFFGGVAATDFTVVSSTSIVATAPPGSVGTINVTVQTDGGGSAPNSGDRFSYTAAPVPTVTGLSTNSLTTAGGTQVGISGSGFTAASEVLFDGVPATFTINADNQITAFSPAEAAGGPYDVTVVTPGGTSGASAADLFTVSNAAAPAVSGLGVSSGTTAGGEAVTISGSGFTGSTTVDFGTVAATDFTVVNDDTIVATAPAEAAEVVDVTVTSYSGTSATSSADDFTVSNASNPTVSSLDVSAGPSTGGTEVTILGANFTGATEVDFGGVSTTDFLVNSDNSISVFAPPETAGMVDVTVSTYAGTSSTSSADEYTYSTAAPPSISSLSTSSGSTAGGTQVTLTGSGFLGVYAINLGNNTIYDFTVNSDSQITFVTPPNPAGVWDLTATSAAGTSNPSSTQFTYTLASAPAVTSLDTSSGSTAGGTTVNLSGSGFTGATAVLFGGVEATDFTINSDSSITAIAPAQAAGTVDVKVQTYGGISASSSADQFIYSTASSPSVSGLATSSGSTAGGTLVSIFGSNFTAASAVSFGSVAAAFAVVSDSLISAIAPAQSAGTDDVTVTTPSGTSSTSTADEFAYTAAAAPTVTGLADPSGLTTGGTPVTILGSGFTGTSSVTFGGFQANWFEVNSDTSVTAWTPNLPAGTLDVRVTTPSGTSSISGADQYTVSNVTAPAPTVTGLDIATGSTAGGQTVLISGTNFSGTTAVDVGGTAATSFVVLDDSDISAVVPAGSAGIADVIVTTNNGTSSPVSADEFTYLSTPAPTVTGLGTSSGTTAGGTSIDITGTDFTGTTAVLFNGVAASSYTVNSATSITAFAPPLPVGTYDITVTTPSGISPTSSADQFTVSAASLPTISSLGTSTGTTAGGTSVSISGSNFTGAQAVLFGGVEADFTVNSDSSITATAPAQYAGTVDVTVVTIAGTSATSSATQFGYTAASAPAITSLGTTTGTTAGGTSVNISGSGFTAATAVLFGNVPAASYTVNSDSSITAVAPPQYAGTVDVKVVTYSGDSASTSDAQFSYTSASSPTVTNLDVSSGSTAGGTTVTLTGSNFTGAFAVSFGSVPAAFTFNSDTSITAVAPSQSTSPVYVTVTTYAGTSATSSVNQFSYSAASGPSVSGLDVTSGSASGGNAVTIYGSGFTAASVVNFGSVAAEDFTVLSDNAILAVAPPQAPGGPIDITVTTPSGISGTSSADQYTYNEDSAPTVTSIDTSSGSTAGGTVVTITGTNFLNATGVSFGGVAANFLVVLATTIQATAPPQMAGPLDITVSNDGGPSALSSADRFTYVAAPAPTITSLSTPYVSTDGTTTLTITGTNLLGTDAINFGSVTATTWTVNSDTSITVTAPIQAAGPPVDIIVSTPSGTSLATSADQVTYVNASVPTVSAISPNSGSASAGTTVTITGTNFLGTTSVSFGTVAADFTVVSATQITATVPQQAPSSPVHVTVQMPAASRPPPRPTCSPIPASRHPR